MTTSKKSTSIKNEDNKLFAIAEASGKQFLFEENKYYDLDRINAKDKEKITLENILLINENDNITIGKPFVENAKIELEVVSHKRGKKVIVYKMRPKKKTRRKMGHRQELTRVMVKSIKLGKKTASKSTLKNESTKKAASSKN